MLKASLFREMSSIKGAMSISKQYDSIMIIDQSVDLLTIIRTQLTYEGLIDEIFGINSCMYVLTQHLPIWIQVKPFQRPKKCSCLVKILYFQN